MDSQITRLTIYRKSGLWVIAKHQLKGYTEAQIVEDLVGSGIDEFEKIDIQTSD